METIGAKKKKPLDEYTAGVISYRGNTPGWLGAKGSTFSKSKHTHYNTRPINMPGS